MSLIKTYLHKLQNGYPIELTISLEDAEVILELLEDSDHPQLQMLADEIRTQTYA